jgi:hypothetical protein
MGAWVTEAEQFCDLGGTRPSFPSPQLREPMGPREPKPAMKSSEVLEAARKEAFIKAKVGALETCTMCLGQARSELQKASF